MRHLSGEKESAQAFTQALKREVQETETTTAYFMTWALAKVLEVPNQTKYHRSAADPKDGHGADLVHRAKILAFRRTP